jgi:hypothetical protein
MLKSFRLLAASAAFVLAGASFAATAPKDTAAKVRTPQQQRMADCNKQATGKKGVERKAFMSTCLKGGSSMAAPATTPQNRMKSCNASAKAKSLKGDPRKAYMSSCLKGKAA